MGGLLTLPSFVSPTLIFGENYGLRNDEVKQFPEIDTTDSGEAGFTPSQKNHRSTIQGIHVSPGANVDSANFL